MSWKLGLNWGCKVFMDCLAGQKFQLNINYSDLKPNMGRNLLVIVEQHYYEVKFLMTDVCKTDATLRWG